ncbi:MAG: site-specific integrase [Acidobacteriia bacterium]|nr:site-specific integrase [Terriglobia bacterium]
MQKITVSIYVRCHGSRDYERANPRKTYSADTIFVLRYKQRGKRVWQTLDVPNYDQAVIQAKKKQIALLVEQANIDMGVLPATVEPKPAQNPHPPLSDLKERFLEFKRTTCKKDGTPLDEETVDAYEQQVTEFLKACQHEYPADVDAMDLRRYMAALRQRGLTHRSVCNNYTSIACFLKFCGVDHKNLLPYSERPTPDDGTPEAYEEAEMRRFFAALTRERDRLAFEVLLKTGLREREMTTLEWADLNLGASPTVTVQSRKPHLKFRTKTGKGRAIPLEKNLALKLAAWKMKYPGTRLLFGTASDKEDSHFYRVCVETAKQAGMDPANFWLHKFRDTFGTWTCRAGKVDLRTLQHWMGHSSITMTERYLAPGQGAYAQDGINQTFNVNLGEDVLVMAAVQ